MQFRLRFSNQIVGVFVLCALLVALGAVVALGINQRWFEHTHEYYSEFGTARGLSAGMSVNFRGFQIGQVSGVSLTEDNTVRVTLTISDRYVGKITEHSVLQLQSNPFGIGGGLVLHQGRGQTEPQPAGSMIPSWNSPQGLALREMDLVAVIAEGDVIAEIMENLPVLLANLNRTAISGAALVQELQDSLTEGADGPIPELLRSAELAGSELRTLLEATGALLEHLRPLTEELREPEGALVRLVGPELEEALHKINETLAHLEQFSGFIAASSPQIRSLLIESRDALETGHEVLQGIRNNPLIRGGIQPRAAAPATFESYRQEEF